MKGLIRHKARKEALQECIRSEYDLIIVGGGITGAGIALDAVSRGFKTLLIEKKDFASGTSSKSTKLIHGGLRYLKQMEFGLVRESGQERAIVHRLAPHLVHPEKMLLPIVDEGSFGKLTASMAVGVYDKMAGVERKDRKKVLNKHEALEQEPLLLEYILRGAILYSEYRTDDARLVFEVLNRACELGADVINYCELMELNKEDGRIESIGVKDHIENQEYKLRSKYLVSAAGPWVDHIRKMDASLNMKTLRLTKGVHLVFEHSRFPVKQSVYFDDFKGRMLFAIPRSGVTYVGTTDTDYSGDPDNVICEEHDKEYILAAVNRYFNDVNLKSGDIISSWAGLRPLISDGSSKATEVSRKDEIFVSSSGLISIAGGKLTGYRKMAERLLDLIQSHDPQMPSGPCRTESHAIVQDGFQDYTEVTSYIQELISGSEYIGLDYRMAEYLVHCYGKRASTLLANSKNYSGDDLSKALMQAEIDHSIDNEACCFPEDFYVRRTGMIYFWPERLKENLDLIYRCFEYKLGWNREYSDSQKEMAVKMLKEHLVF